MPSLFTLIIPAISLLSQVYLFFNIRKIVMSSSRSEPVKSGVVRATGALMVILSCLYLYTMIRPMRWVEPPYIVSLWLYYIPAIWALGSVLSAAILLTSRILISLGKNGLKTVGNLASRPESTPDPHRRAIVQAAFGGLAVAPLFLTGYGALNEAKNFHVREISVPFGRKLRIALLSDIHSGIYMTRRDIRRCADMIIALKPDLFVMTGDYISNSIRFLPACLEEIARIRTACGTYACLGNHDHWHGDPEDLEKIFSGFKITLLNNSHQIINTGSGPLAVIGIEDLLEGEPDLKKALSGIDKGIPRILLSHRPEIFRQAASKEISLTLAGHYHGGQIALKLPGLKFSLAHMRTQYPEGLFQIKDSHMYVTSGIGTTFSPVRLNAPPEIALLNLT